MAGRPKRKLDYAGWSVDIFDNDTKIDKLLDSQGWIGFSIYFYLCQRAFGSDGYFYKWGFDDCASTARRMGGGISSGTISEVVGYCFQVGLFDKRLFDEWGVLTSKGIQRSFWTVAKSRRDKTIFRELWLLKESECEGIIFVPFFDDMSATNDHLQLTNEDMSATNDTVVKESKVNNNSSVATPAEPKPATVTFTEDSFEIRCVEILIGSCLKTFPNSKVPQTLAEKQKWAIEIDRMKRLDGRSEADILKALNYAITDSFWQGNIRSTKKFREKFETLIIRSRERPKQSRSNGFNQFEQNNYDFDSLEKELLGN